MNEPIVDVSGSDPAVARVLLSTRRWLLGCATGTLAFALLVVTAGTSVEELLVALVVLPAILPVAGLLWAQSRAAGRAATEGTADRIASARIADVAWAQRRTLFAGGLLVLVAWLASFQVSP